LGQVGLIETIVDIISPDDADEHWSKHYASAAIKRK
jgi:hypothetical protein